MRRSLVVASLAIVTAVAVPARAATVAVGDRYFDPDVATLAGPGTPVTWEWGAGVLPHNVREDARLFSSGPQTTNPDAVFERSFSAGNFHYYCEVHGFASGGMDGRVRVPVTIAAAPAGRPFTVRWATAATNVGQVFDVQYRLGNGAWVTWRTDASVRALVFGKDGKPTPLRAGRTYSFRARTQRSAAAPLSRSGWSPPRTFQT